jgi:hypothetical protein
MQVIVIAPPVVVKPVVMVAPVVIPIVVDAKVIVLSPIVPLVPIIDLTGPMVRPVASAGTIWPITRSLNTTASLTGTGWKRTGSKWSFAVARSARSASVSRSAGSIGAALPWTRTGTLNSTTILSR